MWAHVWRSEDSFSGLLFQLHMGFGDGAHISKIAQQMSLLNEPSCWSRVSSFHIILCWAFLPMPWAARIIQMCDCFPWFVLLASVCAIYLCKNLCLAVFFSCPFGKKPGNPVASMLMNTTKDYYVYLTRITLRGNRSFKP